jgi:uncharacterized membrane protein YkvA (DUF1232 family)
MLRLLPIRSLVIPFLKLVLRLFLDKRVPVFTKIIPVLALIYLVSPIDVLPDYRLLGIGHLDDIIVVGVLFLVFIAASPKEVVADQTIGRKLRDLQRKQGVNPDQDDSKGKTVDAKIRYIDDDEDDENVEEVDFGDKEK